MYSNGFYSPGYLPANKKAMLQIYFRMTLELLHNFLNYLQDSRIHEVSKEECMVKGHNIRIICFGKEKIGDEMRNDNFQLTILPCCIC
jgi:hypothetical protein